MAAALRREQHLPVLLFWVFILTTAHHFLTEMELAVLCAPFKHFL